MIVSARGILCKLTCATPLCSVQLTRNGGGFDTPAELVEVVVPSHNVRRRFQNVAYATLKLALRFCRWAGYHGPKGLALDACGDIGWEAGRFGAEIRWQGA